MAEAYATSSSRGDAKLVVYRADPWISRNREVRYLSFGYAFDTEGQRFRLGSVARDRADGFSYIAVFFRTTSNNFYCLLLDGPKVKLSHANDRTSVELLGLKNLEIVVGKPLRYAYKSFIPPLLKAMRKEELTDPISEIVTVTTQTHRYKCSETRVNYFRFLRDVGAEETRIISEFDQIWNHRE